MSAKLQKIENNANTIVSHAVNGTAIGVLGLALTAIFNTPIENMPQSHTPPASDIHLIPSNSDTYMPFIVPRTPSDAKETPAQLKSLNDGYEKGFSLTVAFGGLVYAMGACGFYFVNRAQYRMALKHSENNPS